VKSNIPTIFVVGSSRSGTTMTGRILNKHPEVFTFNELHFYEQLWQEPDQTKKINIEKATALLNTLFSTQRDGYFLRKADDQYKPASEKIINNLKSELFPHELYKAFLTHETERNRKKISCEQTPGYVYYTDWISAHFENPKFIHIVRDPRDVFLSQKNRWKRRKFSGNKVPFQQTLRQWINYHPITIAKLWTGANAKIQQNKAKPFYYIIKYENLLTQAEIEVKKICEFIGIAFYDQMIQIPNIGSSLQQDKPDLLGIDKSKINGWKKGGLNPTEIYICQHICKKVMKENAYELEKASPNILLLMYYFAIFPLMGFLALILSFKRVKNIKESFKRRFNQD
jgi:hypothetical protein